MNGALVAAGITARLGDLEILKGVDLVVPFGEVHALMGPNGSGKSTFLHVLMGKGEYQAAGSALVAGAEIMDLAVDERARAGLFAAFQYPVAIPGVTLDDLFREMALLKDDGAGLAERVAETSQFLETEALLERPVNVGLSGGEKKRSEMLQLSAAAPKVAVLDEIDSGLDVDGVRDIAQLVEHLRSPDLGILLITHYSRILGYMNPDRVHVMVDGRIVLSGGAEVAEELERAGYESFRGARAPDPDRLPEDLL